MDICLLPRPIVLGYNGDSVVCLHQNRRTSILQNSFTPHYVTIFFRTIGKTSTVL